MVCLIMFNKEQIIIKKKEMKREDANEFQNSSSSSQISISESLYLKPLSNEISLLLSIGVPLKHSSLSIFLNFRSPSLTSLTFLTISINRMRKQWLKQKLTFGEDNGNDETHRFAFEIFYLSIRVLFVCKFFDSASLLGFSVPVQSLSRSH